MVEEDDDEMRAEYDFGQLEGVVIGKHAAAFRQQTSIVRLDDDLAGRFRDAAAVNAALRAYLEQPGAAAG